MYPHDAMALMASTGAQIYLRGQPTPIFWGKARPVSPDLLDAIQHGATRSLCVDHALAHLSRHTIILPFSLQL